MYVIKGRKMMLDLIKKEQKWEIAQQTRSVMPNYSHFDRFSTKETTEGSIAAKAGHFDTCM